MKINRSGLVKKSICSYIYLLFLAHLGHVCRRPTRPWRRCSRLCCSHAAPWSVARPQWQPRRVHPVKIGNCECPICSHIQWSCSLCARCTCTCRIGWHLSQWRVAALADSAAQRCVGDMVRMAAPRYTQILAPHGHPFKQKKII